MVSSPRLLIAREQIGEAMLDSVTTRGYRETSIEQVLEQAGASREEFDALFLDKQECYLRFYEEMTERFNVAVFGAFERPGPWRDRLRAAAYAAARWMRDNPRETRYGTIDMLEAGELAQAYRNETLRRCVAMIDAGRLELEDPDSVPEMTAQVVLGSIAERLMGNLRRARETGGESFVPEFMSIAVLPYLGEEAAKEELTIPPPAEAANPR